MKKLFKDKKGQVLDNVATLLISLATIAIVLAVTFLILGEAGEQAADQTGDLYADCNSSACNATKATQSAMDQVPDWLSIIVIVVIGGIIIGLVSLFRRSTQ